MSRAQALLSPSTSSMQIPAIIIPPLEYGNNLLTGLSASVSSPMACSKQSCQSDPVKCKSDHVTSKGSPLRKNSLYDGLVASPPLSPTACPHRWHSITPFLAQLALATPASLLFLQSAKHTPAPGPLHLLLSQPGKDLPPVTCQAPSLTSLGFCSNLSPWEEHPQPSV